jgi:hypothetical protein
MTCETQKRNLYGNDCSGRVVDEITQCLFIPLKKSDGTEQTWADLGAFTTWIQGTAQADLELFPTQDELQDFTPESSEATFQEFKNGTRRRLSSGAKTYTLVDTGASTRTHDAYEDLGENDLGVIVIGANGNFMIREKSDGTLAPIPINKGSLSPDYMPSDGAENGQQVTFSFTFSKKIREGEKRTVSQEELGFNLLGYVKPWIDVNVEYSSPTATSVSVYVYMDVEGLKEKTPLTGLLLADFNKLVIVGGADVSITDATEGTEGNYVLTYASQSSVTMKLDAAKDKYNFAIANAQTFDIS